MSQKDDTPGSNEESTAANPRKPPLISDSGHCQEVDGVLGFRFSMTPVSGGAAKDPIPRRITIACRISLTTAWILYAAAMIFPLRADEQAVPGAAVFLVTTLFFWIPQVFPFACCNLLMLTTPLVGFDYFFSNRSGGLYAALLSVGVVWIVPWAYWIMKPIGIGGVCWIASFNFASGAFLTPFLYRRYFCD